MPVSSAWGDASPRSGLPSSILRGAPGIRPGPSGSAQRGVATVSAYDVIVIGSGAGGGTLVHRLAPSGKRILLLERGDWLAREPHNWLAGDVFVDGRYISPATWYDEREKPFQPQVHYFVGVPPSSTARRCTGCASRTSESLAITTAP